MNFFIFKHRNKLMLVIALTALLISYVIEFSEWVLIAITIVLYLVGALIVASQRAAYEKEKEHLEKVDREKKRLASLIPQVQTLSVTRTRKTYYDCGNENPIIKQLRDNDAQSPASFSNKTIIDRNYDVDSYFQCPVDFEEYKTDSHNIYKNVPVIKIIGAGTTNNMTQQNDTFAKNTTYRQALFEHLHGHNLNAQCLEYFEDEHRGHWGMPVVVFEGDRKTRSEKEWEFVQFGEYYFSSVGHQRTIFAMYYLYQKYGSTAVIKNVKVTVCK